MVELLLLSQLNPFHELLPHLVVPPPPATEPTVDPSPGATIVDAALDATTSFSRFRMEFWWMKIVSDSSCKEHGGKPMKWLACWGLGLLSLSSPGQRYPGCFGSMVCLAAPQYIIHCIRYPFSLSFFIIQSFRIQY